MLESLSCIVVDDDPLALKIIENLIAKIDGLECKAYCQSALEAARTLHTTEVDAVFLDVEMPDMSGLELIHALKVKPYIVMMSAQEKYAAPAYDLDVIDYLVKPILLPRFLKAFHKVADLKRQSRGGDGGNGKLFVKIDAVLVGLEISQIVMVEAMADYVRIYVGDKRYTVYSSMKGIAAKLPEPRFMRVHRSYIINVSMIDQVDNTTIIVGGHSVPVGVTYFKTLMDRLNFL